MDTIALDSLTWDFMLDASGNIALASGADAIAQDVASACRTFEGEVYYNTALGIPYWTRILGQLPPLSYLKAQFVTAALTVPDVASAICFISSFANRAISGELQVTLQDGTTTTATF